MFKKKALLKFVSISNIIDLYMTSLGGVRVLVIVYLMSIYMKRLKVIIT